ncbi:MAG: Sigma-70 family polymerase sigma factor [Verrucomicrobiota bacterium]|nr:Sigma-70 family polymerase sigma factor [Verrucomicrobiota bacterium]
MSTDAELLQRYARDRDERAFAELVQRHLGVVYGAALRRTGGRTHLAEDIAQKIFTDLARKAASLSHHPALTGWLHRSTRYAAIDVIRSEQRGQQLSRTLSAMPDNAPTPQEQVEWARLRPVLDEVLDELKESDREAMLLRYFEGLNFAEIGARMNLSENAARMRTERALEKLRGQLGKRGVTSTTAALGLLLANSAFGAAPAGLSATVTTTALASAPAACGLVTFLLMNKIAIPALSAVVAAGVTALVWTSVVPTVSAEELATLRAENARLTQATGPGATPAQVDTVAKEFTTTVTGIARALEERHSSRVARGEAVAAGQTSPAAAEVTPRGHRNRGIATARDAAFTFAWASDICDPDELAKVITFDAAARAKAQEILATMPEAIQKEYPTPEAFYGLVLAATCLEGPPPGADLIERSMVEVELKPGRVAMRRKGSDYNNHEYQLMADGWKHVIPEVGVIHMPNNLNSGTLAKLVQK